MTVRINLTNVHFKSVIGQLLNHDCGEITFNIKNSSILFQNVKVFELLEICNISEYHLHFEDEKHITISAQNTINFVAR